uniref:Tetratricopeptide repeat protein n=1 Tax=candidate division WOR-3 bacterium TaxID=2052148 RepID=A0A7C4XLN5_UNCW3
MAIYNLFSIIIIFVNSYELFSIGCQKELTGDIPGAIEYYKRALSLDTTAFEIYYALANAHYKIQKIDQGIEFAKRGLCFSPDNLNLYTILAVGYIGKGDLKGAINSYRDALKYHPDNLEIYQTISILYEGIGDLKTAKEVLLEIPEEKKTSEIYTRLGTICGRMNDHNGAIGYYQKAFTIDTTNSVALIGIGTGFDILGIKDSSIYYYEKAAQYDTSLSVSKRLIDLYIDTEQYQKLINTARPIIARDYYENNVRRSLGFALYKVGLLEEALSEFLIAEGINPQDTYSKFYIGRIYLEQGRYDEAQQKLNEAIRINPDFVELWIYSGFIALNKRDYKTARYAFTEAAHRNADLAQVYYLLGVIDEMEQKYDRAYFYYRKSLSIEPKSLASLTALANLCDRLDRKDEALALFEKVIEIDTTDAIALNYVGYTYAERAESLDYALRLIEKALAIEPNNGYFVDSRGWVFYQLEKYEEALADLKRANELVEDPVILEHLGDVYMKLKDFKKAVEIYKRVLELQPDNKVVKEKIRQLEER